MDEAAPNTEATSVAPSMNDAVPLGGPDGQQIHAPAVSSRRVAFLIGTVAGGNLISLVLRAIGGPLQGHLVDPAVGGLFGRIDIVAGFTRFLQLGILNGINRELPFYIGKGEVGRARDLAAAAQAWAIALGSLVGFGFFATAFWFLVHREFLTAAGCFTFGLTSFAYFYSDMYLQMTYRSYRDFAWLSLAKVIQDIVALVLILTVIYLSFYGLCLRSVVASAVALILLWRWRPLRIAPKWHRGHLKHLLIIGFPMFIVGLLGDGWKLLDRSFVSHYLGTTDLGIYNVVLMVDTAMDLFPTAIAQVLFPRFAEHFGRTGSVRSLIRMTHKPTLACALAMLPLVLAGWFLAEPMTRLIMKPSYLPGVPAMQWGLVASYIYSFTFVHNVYNIARRQTVYCLLIGLSFTAYYLTLRYLIRDGASLVAFPQAMIAGRIAYVGLGYLFILPMLWSERTKL